MKIVISGIPGFDGAYPLDDDVGWTMRELNIIKRISGVRAGEIPEAIEAGDTDVLGSIAVIAVRQSGKEWQRFEALLWDSSFGSISIEDDDEGTAGEAVPLIPTPPQDSGNNEATPEGSGSDSSDDGDDHPEMNLRAIGGQV